MAKKRTPSRLKVSGEQKAQYFLSQYRGPALSPCAISKSCGGCSYIDLPYESELEIKRTVLVELFSEALSPWGDLVEETVPSPQQWHHRSKITMQMRVQKDASFQMGTCPYGSKSILEIDRCDVAAKEISDFIPELKLELAQRDLSKYRRACLVLRSDGTKLKWGGLGKGSLRLPFEDALTFQHMGVNIQYCPQTFFQSNLFILPKLLDLMGACLNIQREDHFFDLYGGVGLFAFTLGQKAEKVLLIESAKDSIIWAKHNRELNQQHHVELVESAVEDAISHLDELHPCQGQRSAVIDPPRSGLHQSVRNALKNSRDFKTLLYLSCNPETQVRDCLELCSENNWEVSQIIPLDFFPKSYHIESLAVLKRIDKEDA